MVNPTINQFAMTTVQGQMDLQFQGSVITCQVDAAQSGSLIAGQAVRLTTTGGGLPKVASLASDGDETFGFVARNLKDASYAAQATVEIAMVNSVMYMTANGAINPGAQVEVVSASNKIAVWGGINTPIGYALDKASADGDLIRIYVKTPVTTGGSLQTAIVTATLAQINAGLTLIPAATGQAITVTDYTAKVTGAFATGTAVLLQSSNATPVVVSTIAEAALTNGAVNKPNTANNTLGAGFAAALGAGDGLVVANSGSAQTGGTSITFIISYFQK